MSKQSRNASIKIFPPPPQTMIVTKTIPILQSKSLSLKIADAQQHYKTAYNQAIAECYTTLESTEVMPSLYDLQKRLTVWRHHNPAMASGPVHIQRAAITQARLAVIKFNKANLKKRKKSHSRWTDPLSLFKLSNPKTISAFYPVRAHKDNTLYLTGIGKIIPQIKLKDYDIRSWQLVRTTKKLTGKTRQDQHTYSLHIQIKQPDPVPVQTGHTIGVDVGIVHPATTYDTATNEATFHDIPDSSRRQKHDRISKLQSRQASLKKASRKWKHVQRLMRAAKKKIANRQTEFERKTSVSITKNANHVVMEDLNITGLSAKKRGAAGAGLNRELRYTRLGALMDRIEQTCHNKGIKLSKVSPHYTSQTCGSCGATDKNSRRSQSEFQCTSCGFEENADINAAKVIAAKAVGNIVSRHESPENVYASPSSNLKGLAKMPEKSKSEFREDIDSCI